MNPVKRRLICLNLVLLLILTLTLPVSGSQSLRILTLHGNGGTIYGNESWAFVGEVQLPEAVFSKDTFLGWSTSLSVTPTDLFLLPGSWYRAGDTVSAEEISHLYAHGKRNGQYAMFDPNGGTVKNGGEVILYGSVTTTDLIIVTPDETAVTAPEGYTFRGWDLNGTPYAAGAKLQMRSGTTLYLQAKWDLLPTVTQLENGLYIQFTDPIRLYGETDAAYVGIALYDENEKMLTCDLKPTENGEIDIQIPKNSAQTCKIFTLNTTHTPIQNAITLNID